MIKQQLCNKNYNTKNNINNNDDNNNNNDNKVGLC